MFTMQVFHKWLSSTAKAPNDYRLRLARLARLTRGQILRATGELTWVIWHDAKAETVNPCVG